VQAHQAEHRRQVTGSISTARREPGPGATQEVKSATEAPDMTFIGRVSGETNQDN